MFSLPGVLASTIAELIALAAVVAAWVGSGVREDPAGAHTWCERRRIGVRDRIVLGCIGGVLVLSAVYRYQFHGGTVTACLGPPEAGHLSTSEQVAAAVCQATYRAQVHRNGRHGVSIVLFVALLIIGLIGLGRITGIVAPLAARMSTRALALVADLLLVLTVWRDPPYDTSRTWAVWMTAALVIIASLAMMRHTRWPPRWMAG